MADKATEDDAGGVATATGPAPEFVFYNPHPLLSMYPSASADDLGAMEADVKKNGVQQQIVLWTDGKSRKWVIDGRTRQDAAANVFRRLVDEGKPPLTDNGLSLQPDVYEFTGSADDVFRFIQRTNTRKHYTPGQKAAIRVTLYYYEFKRDHGGRVPPLDVEMSKDYALSSEQLAREAGCSVPYIRVCRRLYRESTELLDAVRAGVIPPIKAEQQLNRKGAGTGTSEGDAPSPPEDGKPVKDGHGNEVPDDLVDVFKARSGFDVVCNHIADALRAATKVAAGPGGDWLDMPGLEAILNSGRKFVRLRMPHEVCKACGGKGKDPATGKKCKVCNKAKFIPKYVIAAAGKAERMKVAKTARKAARTAADDDEEKAAAE